MLQSVSSPKTDLGFMPKFEEGGNTDRMGPQDNLDDSKLE